MVKVVILLVKGDIKEVDLILKSSKLDKEVGKVIKGKIVNDYCDNIGACLTEICRYEYDEFENSKLVLFGFIKKGKAGMLNTHVLPPCKSSYNNLYGDIIVSKITDNNKLLSFTTNEYENFYTENIDNYINDEEDADEYETNSSGNDEEVVDAVGLDDAYIGEKTSNNVFSDNEDLESEEDEMNSENLEGEDEEDDEKEGGDYCDTIPVCEEVEEENEEYIENDNLKELDKLVDTATDDYNLNEENLDDVVNEDDNLNEVLPETEEIQLLRESNVSLLNELIKDITLSKNIEENIFKYVCEVSSNRKILKSWDNELFKKIYFNKCRSLYSNLDKNSYIKNVNLLDNIRNGTISVNTIAFMSFQELFPSHWKKMMDEKYKKEKLLYEQKAEAMTDQFKCGRCKSKKCTYYELQTRSADEAMTIFITCLNCGNRWKQ